MNTQNDTLWGFAATGQGLWFIPDQLREALPFDLSVLGPPMTAGFGLRWRTLLIDGWTVRGALFAATAGLFVTGG
jgi:hypothetical protein